MSPIELIIAASLLASSALIEAFWTQLESIGKARRWAINVALAIVWIGLVNMLWPVMYPVLSHSLGGVALDLPSLRLSPVLTVLGSLLILDFLQYWTHRLIHAVPWLWALHRVHHSDRSVDASTGIRHHPLEPLLNAPMQFSFIMMLSVPLIGVAVYGLCATVEAIFAHANVRLPPRLDRLARQVIVTPDMHRVHHSIRVDEANTNFGMLFPFWDRLFGTYRAAPKEMGAQFQAGVA